MGIESGFYQGGFLDDRAEQSRWRKLEERLNGSNSNMSGDDKEEDVDAVDGTLNIDDNKEWVADTQKNLKTYKSRAKKNFFQRNKRQIMDAVIVLGVIYVCYKLFWEQDGGDFEDGGHIDMEPAPQPQPAPSPAPAPTPAPTGPPPRVEMPEPTYNPQ